MWSSNDACHLAAAILCGMLVGSSAAAQPPPQHASQEQQFEKSIRARSELVNVDVFVADARGDFVSGLGRENFRIFDEGVVQEITHFAAVETPARVLVLVETSPAVYLLHKQHLAAAQALFDGLSPEDEVALARYDDSFRIVCGFTRSREAIRQALGLLSYNLGMAEIQFFGAVAAALDWLAPHAGKKALVLLTTGLNSAGTDGWDSLQSRLQAGNTVVFAIALGGELRNFREQNPAQAAPGSTRLSFAEADRALRAIAALTGGLAFFPKNSRDFAEIYRHVAANLRHQYSLAFVPRQHDGRFHRIAIEVIDSRGRPLPSGGRGGFQVRARSGYLAPQH
jgi:VWFA-related protein